MVGVDLQVPVFTHGQLYVALSRTTNMHDLTILLPPNGDGTVLNIVYPEVLLPLTTQRQFRSRSTPTNLRSTGRKNTGQNSQAVIN